MCRKVDCSKCGKASWAGCGAHIDVVMADVPESDRCECQPSGMSMPKWLAKVLRR